jgi:16S rRNA (cytosine967-C5)-methyltransferase
MLQIQLTAARILATVLAGKSLNETLDRELAQQPELTLQQRAAIREACYDSLRHYGFLCAQLRELLQTPAKPAELEALLLIALAQLQFGRAKPYAIVDHAVRATELLGAVRAKGLVNAVLRNYLRKKSDLPKRVLTHPEARFNLPAWWIEKLVAQYPEDWENMAECALRHPPLTLRVNLRRTTVAEQQALLQAAGFSVTLVGPIALEVSPPRPVSEIPGFGDGKVSVQDAGAQHAAPNLDARNGMRVLDACAAPGGKTGHILEHADVALVALDSDPLRVRRIESNLERLKATADVRAADAAEPGAWWDGYPFDRILLDVPCSGSGVIRRHPDIKWLRRPGDLATFAATQLGLLVALWNCLSKGGRLLYATCSVFQEENGEVVDSFISRTQAAGRSVRRVALPAVPQDSRYIQPKIRNGQLLPDDHHDGFYYALLEKG